MATGSLYRAGYDLRLFEDVVARRVGDILTIRLEEKTDAKKKADTGLGKSSSFDGSIDAGTSGAAEAVSADLSMSADRDFDGQGESKQSNSLDGNISVVVSEVLPNGNLVVRGEKWMTLNQGDEFIRITGIVRPQDIDPDNTVPSYLVADARIGYGGTGPVADSNALGWLGRFFISAIFPF
jgi:flagellar L-ring protein precursor FlgH